jgi:predicted nicotinamide N-methyase
VISDRRRILRLLGDRPLAPFWLARFAERTGDWLFLLTLLVLAWNGTLDAALAAWTLALWLAPRLIVWGVFEGWMSRLPGIAWPLLSAARAVAVLGFLGIVAADLLPDSQAILGAAGVLGFLAAVGGDVRTSVLRTRLDLGKLGNGATADAVVDRTAMLVGALLAGLILYVTEPAVALVAAAILLALAAILGLTQVRGVATSRTDAERRAAPDLDPDAARAVARRSAIYVVAAFTSGALGAVLMVASLALPAGSGHGDAGAAPFLIAAVAAGLLVGPLPVPRLLLRVSAPLLLLGLVLVESVVALFIVVFHSAIAAVPVLFILGLVGSTMDSLRAIALRRLAPVDLFDRITRLSLLALTVGQLYGAIGVISIGLTPDPFAILVVLSISQVFLVGLGIALGGRNALRVGGLSSLPIKSVVHKLSWDTRPAATTADFAGANPRERRLGRWINRQVEVEKLSVTLPISNRHYEIYRPDEASRERLFEQGRADPEKQMPYWAKVWPSGVALADVVAERKEEVSDKHVLELGAGLGVTACAVLEYGGHLVTADYSALPLAHCRLNTLVNSGRAPRATCFNWRHDSEVAAVSAKPEFRDGFPLIIAGDVLYEGRDAEPLLNVIERMLNEDGSLWLAEPVRKTAQRFLDSAASLGWEIDSRQVQAEWPDATDGPVNIHFLTRSHESDRTVADLGGFRI